MAQGEPNIGLWMAPVPGYWKCSVCGDMHKVTLAHENDHRLPFIPALTSPLVPSSCGHGLAHNCILYQDNSITPFKLAGGLNLHPDRLIPVGWSCCFHNPEGREGGPYGARFVKRLYGLNALDHYCVLGGHDHEGNSSTHCKQYFVVNCFYEPLIYLDNLLYLDAENKLVASAAFETFIPSGAFPEHCNHYYDLKHNSIEPLSLPGATPEAVLSPPDVLRDCAIFARRVWEDLLYHSNESINVNFLHPIRFGQESHKLFYDLSYQGAPPLPTRSSASGPAFDFDSDPL